MSCMSPDDEEISLETFLRSCARREYHKVLSFTFRNMLSDKRKRQKLEQEQRVRDAKTALLQLQVEDVKARAEGELTGDEVWVILVIVGLLEVRKKAK